MKENDYGTRSKSCVFRQVFVSNVSGANTRKAPPTDEAAIGAETGSGRKKEGPGNRTAQNRVADHCKVRRLPGFGGNHKCRGNADYYELGDLQAHGTAE